MTVAGFLFLFILVLNLVMSALGYKIEIGEFDIDAKLLKFAAYPNRFRISVAVALIEHVSIIVLAILLFRVFGPYSLILGLVWTVFRTGEGVVQLFNEINYWGLLRIAGQYSVSNGAGKKSLTDSARNILQTKYTRFNFAMVLWSVGTLAYSLLFVIYGLVPPLLGWLGLVASIFSGFGSGIKLVNPSFQLLSAIGGLSAILFEILLGGWLIFLSLLIP